MDRINVKDIGRLHGQMSAMVIFGGCVREGDKCPARLHALRINVTYDFSSIRY